MCWCPPEVVFSTVPLLVGKQLLHASFQVGSCSLLPAMSPSLQAGCALPRVVEQFHYLLWPDHGVPRNPAQLLCLVEVVNKRVLEAPAGPVLVHCRYRGSECLGAGARLAGAVLTPNFLCPQCWDRTDRYLHCPGLPPEDGEGRGGGGCVSLRAEAAGAAGQHGADQGEECYLLPACCQAADLLRTLPRDVACKATLAMLFMV